MKFLNQNWMAAVRHILLTHARFRSKHANREYSLLSFFCPHFRVSTAARYPNNNLDLRHRLKVADCFPNYDWPCERKHRLAMRASLEWSWSDLFFRAKRIRCRYGCDVLKFSVVWVSVSGEHEKKNIRKQRRQRRNELAHLLFMAQVKWKMLSFVFVFTYRLTYRILGPILRSNRHDEPYYFDPCNRLVVPKL